MIILHARKQKCLTVCPFSSMHSVTLTPWLSLPGPCTLSWLAHVREPFTLHIPLVQMERCQFWHSSKWIFFSLSFLFLGDDDLSLDPCRSQNFSGEQARTSHPVLGFLDSFLVAAITNARKAGGLECSLTTVDPKLEWRFQQIRALLQDSLPKSRRSFP